MQMYVSGFVNCKLLKITVASLGTSTTVPLHCKVTIPRWAKFKTLKLTWFRKKLNQIVLALVYIELAEQVFAVQG